MFFLHAPPEASNHHRILPSGGEASILRVKQRGETARMGGAIHAEGNS
jgi:hypothetical protein